MALWRNKRNSKAHGNRRSPLNRLAIRPYTPCGGIWFATPCIAAVCRLSHTANPKWFCSGKAIFIHLSKSYIFSIRVTVKWKNLNDFHIKWFVLGFFGGEKESSYSERTRKASIFVVYYLRERAAWRGRSPFRAALPLSPPSAREKEKDPNESDLLADGGDKRASSYSERTRKGGIDI